MTEIKIKRLSLENFKCHKSLSLNLDGGNASIYGDNAAGKTSIYDALVWLLFGKDSQGHGEKNIEIKPLNSNGEVADHDALTAVEAALLVNGEEITLRRTYKEVWTTKRGSGTATYDGNTSEYYVDGVPCKKIAFQSKVNELADENAFRMLTSVSHFAEGISWQDRRGELFKLAGVLDDRTILASDSQFQPLLGGMGRLTLEDYKKKLLAEKKGLVGAKSEIPARISECEKTIADVMALDFRKARMELVSLQEQAEAVGAQMLAIRNNQATQQKQQELRAAHLELAELEVENKAHRASQNTVGINIGALTANVAMLEQQRKNKALQIATEERYIADCDKKIIAAREEWVTVNAEVFAGGTCPACGQALPAEKLTKAVEDFEARKRCRLEDILRVANSYKTAKATADERITVLQGEVEKLDADIQNQKQMIADAEVDVAPVVDLADYAQRKQALEERIHAISDEIMDMQSDTAAVLDGLKERKADIDQEIAFQQSIISKEGLLDYSQQRVEELRKDAQKTAAALDAVERMLYLMEAYSRYKTRFVEDSINGMFRIARFRLFREQGNGGVEERCDVVHNGVPYTSVNNGMKINLGIDIINTLSRAYGVYVPLFVDNAESVTSLEPATSQMIQLVVSGNDKELRIEYEN